MIFDRTQSDVDSAIEIINRRVKIASVSLVPPEDLTPEELEILSRGTLNIVDLNRIEGKQKELKETFNSLGYWRTPVISKNWNHTYIFDESDFERILNNTEVLKKAFFVYGDTPKTPNASYNYTIINDIEKILHDLDRMSIYLIGNLKECGTFECGEG